MHKLYKETMTSDKRAMRYVLGIMSSDLAEAKDEVSLMSRPEGLLGVCYDAIASMSIETEDPWDDLADMLMTSYGTHWDQSYAYAAGLAEDYRLEHATLEIISESERNYRIIIDRIMNVPGVAQWYVDRFNHGPDRERAKYMLPHPDTGHPEAFWKGAERLLDNAFGGSRRWKSMDVIGGRVANRMHGEHSEAPSYFRFCKTDLWQKRLADVSKRYTRPMA